MLTGQQKQIKAEIWRRTRPTTALRSICFGLGQIIISSEADLASAEPGYHSSPLTQNTG